MPLLAAWRLRGSRSLDEESAEVPRDAPLVSVIVPARNEAGNIGRCVRSILRTTWPAMELTVVDDHSTDGTADVARAAAEGDPRLRILVPPPLPDDWFGKQWACAAGAAGARGALLCFTDADTFHGPELLARSIAVQRRTGAALVSVAGRQLMETFWERALQPQVFTILFLRFGGTERVNRSRKAVDKIANGQYLLFERSAYDALGGHHAVRDTVVEDLALAQHTFASGHATVIVAGEEHLETRMYTSLRELVRGWRKNVYAGGLRSMPGGRIGRAFFPVLLLGTPIFTALPALVLLALGLAVLARSLGADVGSAPTAALVWAAVSTAASLTWWAVVYRAMRQPVLYALAFPAGALLLVYISLAALVRGRRVEWKGREYRSA